MKNGERAARSTLSSIAAASLIRKLCLRKGIPKRIQKGTAGVGPHR